MVLNELIKKLVDLQLQGHGGKQVFARHGASSDCNPVGSARITAEVSDESGPFDLEEGEQYVSIYVGN